MSRIRTWEVLVIIPEVLGNISFSFCMKKKKKKKKNLNKKKQYLRRNLMFSYVHKYCFTEVCCKRGQRFKSLLLAGFLFGELEQK